LMRTSKICTRSSPARRMYPASSQHTAPSAHANPTPSCARCDVTQAKRRTPRTSKAARGWLRRAKREGDRAKKASTVPLMCGAMWSSLLRAEAVASKCCTSHLPSTEREPPSVTRATSSGRMGLNSCAIGAVRAGAETSS
jgi:hypothetical protein